VSQNFELLSQLEAEFQFRRAIPRDAPATAKPLEIVEDAERSQQLLTLAQTVFLSGNANAPHQVVLCGVDRDNSSSEICLSLGKILARQSTRPVCLADANAHAPRLLKQLEEDHEPPLADQDQCTEIEPKLWLCDLVASSSANHLGLASVDQIKERFNRLKTRFEFILIDAPGANTGGDAALLSQLVDGAILIIEATATRKAAAFRAKQALEAVNARILGSVLNNRSFPIPERLYRKL
jgi:Mrp family chromosome partitioning ATPase